MLYVLAALLLGLAALRGHCATHPDALACESLERLLAGWRGKFAVSLFQTRHEPRKPILPG